ncbi:hypothetical protein C8J56DRAFT_1043597 [Mycena floridula]|nr:hypothetical protein C8J56DRAFT_1043597 [Mycena floridula]
MSLPVGAHPLSRNAMDAISKSAMLFCHCAGLHIAPSTFGNELIKSLPMFHAKVERDLTGKVSYTTVYKLLPRSGSLSAIDLAQKNAAWKTVDQPGYCMRCFRGNSDQSRNREARIRDFFVSQVDRKDLEEELGDIQSRSG